MYYLAFDVSKKKLDGVLTNLRTRNKYFQIDNEQNSIIDWLDKTELPKKLIVGCESTGNYHLLVLRTLVERGFSFKLINPLLVKQFTRTTIRKKKTDISDSLIIAKLLAQGEGRIISSKETDLTAKVLARTLKKLTKERVKFQLIRQSLKLHSENESLLFLDENLGRLEQEIKKTIKEQVLWLKKKYAKEPIIELLSSIPGIGFRLALAIWTEIDDIERFESAKQLIAFAGLDPQVRQSGHCLNNSGKLTKRGSPHLRRALFIAANVARRFDPELRVYYEKKRSEGKKFTVATCAVARKISNRIFAVWKRQTPYVKREALQLQTLRIKTAVIGTAV